MPPVEDHPVHEHGVRVGEYRAGCHNRGTFSPGYYATNRSYEGKQWRLVSVWVPHKMSTTCRQIIDLPECKDCTAPKDKEYIDKMRAL
jgi:hypothetical protein